VRLAGLARLRELCTAAAGSGERGRRGGGLSPGKGGARSPARASPVPAKEQGVIRCLCTPSEGSAAELAEGEGRRGLRSAADIPLPSFVPQEICASSLPSAAPCSIATRCGSPALLVSPAGSGAARCGWAGSGLRAQGFWGTWSRRLSCCVCRERAGLRRVVLPSCWAGTRRDAGGDAGRARVVDGAGAGTCRAATGTEGRAARRCLESRGEARRAARSPAGDNLQPQAGSGSMGEAGGWHAWRLESAGDPGVSHAPCAPGGPGREPITVCWDGQEAAGVWAQAGVTQPGDGVCSSATSSSGGTAWAQEAWVLPMLPRTC